MFGLEKGAASAWVGEERCALGLEKGAARAWVGSVLVNVTAKLLDRVWRTLLHSIVLYCIVLCCIVLFCTVLCCSELYGREDLDGRVSVDDKESRRNGWVNWYVAVTSIGAIFVQRSRVNFSHKEK